MDDQENAEAIADGVRRLVPSLVASLREHQGKRVPSVPDAAPKLEYHLFADAVYWSDEFAAFPRELDDAFRVVLNHRTSMLLGEVGKFPEVWEAAKECFPNWIGFQSERLVANAEVADRITRIRRVSSQKIDRWFADPKNPLFPAD